uniref:Uncharacterized protein n=1 Tax=Catagonus wagneri TaxID=51154 RepID=A0A8C3WZ24_9CETA
AAPGRRRVAQAAGACAAPGDAAGVCRRQQCSVERRGFRQELDSWRHKLIHCVGFESILEGLFGPALLKDLSLFKAASATYTIAHGNARSLTH